METHVEKRLETPLPWQPLSIWLAIAMVAVIALSVTFLSPSSFEANFLTEIPSVGLGSESARRKEFLSGGAQTLYAEGYRKFKNGVFRITTPRESPCIVIAPKFLAELDKLPEDVLSRRAASNELMHIRHVKMDGAPPGFQRATSGYINPSLGRLTSVIAETIRQAIRTELPQTSEWSLVNMNAQLLRLTAMASGRAFVGSEMCRDEEYLDNAIHFTTDVMKAVASVALMPVWLRPILSPFVPFVKALQQRIQRAKRFLQPVIQSRRQAASAGDPARKPDDLLEWFINNQAATGIQDDMDIVHSEMVTSFAAVHTSSQTMTNMLYTLAANPVIVDTLRKEVHDVLIKHKGGFTVQSLQDLKKMDSFAKETMRYYPLMAAAVQRKVLRSFTLSNGQTIPAGAILEVANGAICNDGEIFESPEVFDALRFYKIREGNNVIHSNANSERLVATPANSQFVSTGPLSLWWGYGKYACPGRFLASTMIKIIIANILMHFEIKLPDGVTERYSNITYGDMVNLSITLRTVYD